MLEVIINIVVLGVGLFGGYVFGIGRGAVLETSLLKQVARGEEVYIIAGKKGMKLTSQGKKLDIEYFMIDEMSAQIKKGEENVSASEHSESESVH